MKWLICKRSTPHANETADLKCSCWCSSNSSCPVTQTMHICAVLHWAMHNLCRIQKRLLPLLLYDASCRNACIVECLMVNPSKLMQLSYVAVRRLCKELFWYMPPQSGMINIEIEVHYNQNCKGFKAHRHIHTQNYNPFLEKGTTLSNRFVNLFNYTRNSHVDISSWYFSLKRWTI